MTQFPSGIGRLRLPAVVTVAVCLGLAAGYGGADAWWYSLAYAAAMVPGVPLGIRLFGRKHPVAWMVSAAIGYSLTATVLWATKVAGWSPVWVAPALPALAIVAAWRWRTSPPLVRLPRWSSRATLGGAASVLVTAAVVSVPYARIGERDAHDYLRYRAYFTADFLWHEALTAELARPSVPPRNPYLAAEPLAYYWTYFVVPATVTSLRHVETPPIQSYLRVNGFWTATIVTSLIFACCWCAVPRGTAAAIATIFTLLATSGEGLYGAWRVWRAADSLYPLRDLNVDALTYWWFGSLTIDGLPRAFWYNPQHSLACALGLAVLILLRRPSRRSAAPAVGLAAGLVLGLGLLISPFPAGAFGLVAAGLILWQFATDQVARLAVVSTSLAAIPGVTAALWWCLRQGMVSGAGGALTVGWSDLAWHQWWVALPLALGPLLLVLLAGATSPDWRRRARLVIPSLLGLAVGLALYFFVTLTLEPIWIGWRAGQVILVTAPPAVALLLTRRRTRMAAPLVALAFAIGLPTTAIDWFNAQDVSNVDEGPGFHWTILVSPEQQAAFEWIQRHTAPDATVQPAPGPRGRDTWSVVPSFARRRMAAGLPISLLLTEEMRRRAAVADSVFSDPDPARAWITARELGIDYLFIGAPERRAFPAGSNKFSSRPDLFPPVFSSTEVTIVAVGCQAITPCR